MMLSILLLPSIIRTEIRVTSTAAHQNVGLWWDANVRQFVYEDIASIEITTAGGSSHEPAWNIVWRSGDVETFNPGDLWSANQWLIRERMEQHGVVFNDPPKAR